MRLPGKRPRERRQGKAGIRGLADRLNELDEVEHFKPKMKRDELRVAKRPPLTRAMAAIVPSGADMPCPCREAESMRSP